MEMLAILVIVAIVLFIEHQVFLRLVLKNVTYTVRFSTDEAMEGETFEIVEEIVNDKGLPVPWVKTELSTSRWLEFAGTQAARASDTRFVPSVFSLRPHQKCTRTRRAVAMKRGNFKLESVSLIGSDLLGLVSVSRALSVNESIRILPAPYDLRESTMSDMELSGERAARRFICDDPFLISGSREYTGREPMNRVHWSSTAKNARLMVFNNDYTTRNRAAVVINMQKTSVGEPRPVTSGDCETYIKAAAFLLDRLADIGAECDLYSNGSGGVHEKGGEAPEDYMRLLRVLADMENTCTLDFRDFLIQAEESGLYFADRTDILIVTPYIDDTMADFAAMQRRRGKHVAFYCNDDSVHDREILRVGRVARYYG